MYSGYNMDGIGIDRCLDLAWENYLFKKSGDNVSFLKIFFNFFRINNYCNGKKN